MSILKKIHKLKNILNTFFYYYYKFYSRVLPSIDDPKFVSILVISLIEGIITNILLESIYLYITCRSIDNKIRITIQFFFVAINLYYFYVKIRNMDNEILSKKPLLFFNNEKFTIFIIVFVSILIISWFYWGAFYFIYLDKMLNC